MQNPTLDSIFGRRSIRKYTDQPVEPEKLDLLLQAAMAAPSAMNCKPWEFVLVTEPEKLAQFRSRLIFGNRNAPAAIVVCGNPPPRDQPGCPLILGGGLFRRHRKYPGRRRQPGTRHRLGRRSPGGRLRPHRAGYRRASPQRHTSEFDIHWLCARGEAAPHTI